MEYKMANNLPKTVGLNAFFNPNTPSKKTEEQNQVTIKDIFKPVSKLFRFVDPINQSDEMIDYLVTQQHFDSVQFLTTSKVGNNLNFKA